MAIALRTRSILLGASFLLCLGSASAEDDAATLCNGGDGISLDMKISGCTAFIDAGTDSVENLVVAYNNRGNAYDDKGQPDLAIQDYERAMQLQPGDAKPYFNRGAAYYNKGEYARALQDFDEAIRLRPDYAKALTARGNAKKQMGDIAGGDADIAAAKALAL